MTSTFFTGPVFTNYGGLIANKKYEGGGFAATLGEKDMRLALAAAERLRVPMPLASLVHDRLQTLIARGRPEPRLVGDRTARGAGRGARLMNG